MDGMDKLVVLAGGPCPRMHRDNSRVQCSVQKSIHANERAKDLIALDKKGRPLLDRLLNNAKGAGFRDIYLVIGEQEELYKDFYGPKERDNPFHGLRISYAVQRVSPNRTKPLGTADALYQAMERYPGLKTSDFAVCDADNLYSEQALLALRETTETHALLACDRNALQVPPDQRSKFALVRLDYNGKVWGIADKPTEFQISQYRRTCKKLWVSMNAFKFEGKAIHPYLKNCPLHPEHGGKEIHTALLNLIADYPDTVLGIPITEDVPDLKRKVDVPIIGYFMEHGPSLNWIID